MDTEVKPPPQENGSKIEDKPTDTASEAGSEDSTKEVMKQVKNKQAPVTRNRSTTPQNRKPNKNSERNEEPKTQKNGNHEEGKKLSLSLKKPDDEINGHSDKAKPGKKNSKQDVNEKEDSDKEKNGHEQTKTDDVKEKESKSEDIQKDATIEETVNDKGEKNTETNAKNSDSLEMDPLVLASDEPDPELQFDENSDLESGKGSPIQTRCKTRRSQTRYVPTPKTPKSNDSDSEVNSVAPTPTPDPSDADVELKPENLNDTNDSADLDKISMLANAGNDVTRLEYASQDITITSEDSSYLNSTRDKSLRETLRGLTPRRTIRPLNDSYRLKAFKNTHHRSALNLPFMEDVERITSKRKSRSITPEERKRFKGETGFSSYFSNPLNNFKSKFKSNVPSPKLTAYKDSSKEIHEEIGLELVPYEPLQDKKSWCSVM